MLIKKCDICGRVVDELYILEIECKDPREEDLNHVFRDGLCNDCATNVLKLRKKWKEDKNVN